MLINFFYLFQNTLSKETGFQYFLAPTGNPDTSANTLELLCTRHFFRVQPKNPKESIAANMNVLYVSDQKWSTDWRDVVFHTEGYLFTPPDNLAIYVNNLPPAIGNI